MSPANPGKEFLLGDVPAVTVASVGEEFGLSQAITVDEAGHDLHAADSPPTGRDRTDERSAFNQ